MLSAHKASPLPPFSEQVRQSSEKEEERRLSVSVVAASTAKKC